jgi:hypothetical protein
MERRKPAQGWEQMHFEAVGTCRAGTDLGLDVVQEGHTHDHCKHFDLPDDPQAWSS